MSRVRAARRAAPVLLALAAPLAGGCGPAPGGARGDADPPPAEAWFEECAQERGVDFAWRSGHREQHYFPEIMGGGAALFDMEGDGDLDLYLVQGGSLHPDAAEPVGNVLLENDGGGHFRDVSEGSGAADTGYGMGVACGDVDGDGLEDLFVTNVGRNTLLRNRGAGRFEDVTEDAGLVEEEWSTSAGFFDYDRDGDLDLFVVNYVEWSRAGELDCRTNPQPWDYCSPKSYDAPAPDTLYRNEGDGRFTNVSAQAGLLRVFGNGLGVVIGDLNGDGFEDVFVANDGTTNQLWLNQGGTGFEDGAVRMGCAADQDGLIKAGMGTHAIDLDDDGDEDLLVVNLNGEPDSYFRNDGAFFSDRTQVTGLGAISRSYTRFGMGFADFDQDGYADLFQANGRVARAPEAERGPGADPYAQEDLLLRGSAAQRFQEVVPRGGTAATLAATSRGAAFGDVDGDGDVDVVVVNRDAPAHLLLNRVAHGGWIRFRVRERGGRHALGAELRLAVGERELFRVVRSAYSYCASSDARVHLGLGPAREVRDVEVTWADGTRELFGDFPAGAEVELVRGAGRAPGS